MPFSQDIEKLFRARKYKPMSSEEIAQALEIAPGDLAAFQANLDTMEYNGRLARVRNRYTTPAHAGLVIGRLDVARGGFGFVVPLDRKQNPQDLYVAQRDMATATEGDIVAATAVKSRPGMQPVGKVSYIVKRHRVNFVGRYVESGGRMVVLVDGGGAISEIEMSRTQGVHAQPGEKVVVEIESWPRADVGASGHIVEVLGAADDPTTDTISVIREFNLPEEFGDEALAQADAIGDVVRAEDIEGRLDLRKRTIITIDPVHARDFDDAISIKRTADGWLLGVHIADVSSYVTPGSAVDIEATERGTSVYLPTRVIPMIPHTISNGIASLREGEDRLTKSIIMNYNRQGQLLGYEVHKSVIRSARRMTYEQASEVLAGRPPEGIELSPEVKELLTEAAALAHILEKRRQEAGMLELDMPEVEVEVDGAGEVTGVKPAGRDWSHKLIEMFMVAANEAVAEFMTARNLPHLRRVHEEPSEEDLQALKVFLTGMGFVVRDVEDRFQLQSILKRARGCPEAPIINLAVLKSMKRAQYSPELKGHYALASRQYSHYTSPIRRYPDLIVHQVLDDFLLGRMDSQRRHYWETRMPQAGLMSSMQERRADEAEQELTKLKILRYLEKHQEEEFDGIITGVKQYGLFIELAGLIVDGFIHVSELPERGMRYDERGRRLTGGKKGFSLRLGDPVVVRIKAIDLPSRKLDLSFVAKGTRAFCERPAQPGPEVEPEAAEAKPPAPEYTPRRKARKGRPAGGSRTRKSRSRKGRR